VQRDASCAMWFKVRHVAERPGAESAHATVL